MALETEIDGIRIKINPLRDVELQRGRGVICKFRCRCGLGEIRVTRGELEGDGGAGGFSAVRSDMELTKEWNELQTRAQKGGMDFLDYEEEMGLWKERRRIKSSLEILSEYETTLRTQCPFCERTYRLLVKMENPLRALEAMDPIEAFRRLGVDLRRHAKPLARVGFRRGFESPKAYLQYLKTLAEEEDLVGGLTQRLGGKVEALLKESRTKFTASQLRSLKESIDRFSAEYERKHGVLLESELRALIAESRG